VRGWNGPFVPGDRAMMLVGRCDPEVLRIHVWESAMSRAGPGRMSHVACAYCGKLARKPEREHVIPKCLYPLSKSKSRVQRLTVPACRECNNGWSDDEAHFRNMLLIAGEPNGPVRELWDTTAQRSFDKADGPRRIRDLLEQMKPVDTADGIGHMVYPGKDPRVIRVLRKVVRGLCHYHQVLSPVSDRRIWADVMKYVVPEGFLKEMAHHHREADIFEYRYQILNDEMIHSAWLLTFFERLPFIALVSTASDGWPDPDQAESPPRKTTMPPAAL